ncbi:MAG TPA: DUF1524 domain-containing protein, partial [Myxococcota bacterium]|nr:DUF1524 domain-containing protein [Myxococcota bacterium]
RDEAVRKLGNLSILSSTLNVTIRDASWADKCNGVGKKAGLKHYASGLETLSPALQKSVWDEAAIHERGSWLAQQALEVWPYPSVTPTT